MDYTGLPYVVEPMQIRDIDAVMEIERASFPSPWPAYAYRHELLYNAISHYFVVRWRKEEPSPLTGLRYIPREKEKPSVLGYGGFRLMAGEAHISNLAVWSSWRGIGIGELLLTAMLDRAVELGAEVATLEVRISNTVAQNLYRKYGFGQVGLRRHYYRHSGEDALVMATERLTSVAFQSRFRALKQVLGEKLIQSLDKIPQMRYNPAQA